MSSRPVRSLACIAEEERVALSILTGARRQHFDLCATDAEALGYALIQEAHVALGKELPVNVWVSVPHRLGKVGAETVPETDSPHTSQVPLTAENAHSANNPVRKRAA